MQGFAPLHHLVVAAGHLPGAVDAPVRAVRLKGHELEILGTRLEIVKRGGGMHRVAERRMLGHVADRLAVKKDGAAVLERLDVLGSGFAIAHRQFLPVLWHRPPSGQAVGSLDVLRRKPADAVVRPTAARVGADHGDLVGQRSVVERKADAVVMRADVQRILVR